MGLNKNIIFFYYLIVKITRTPTSITRNTYLDIKNNYKF